MRDVNREADVESVEVPEDKVELVCDNVVSLSYGRLVLIVVRVDDVTVEVEVEVDVDCSPK